MHWHWLTDLLTILLTGAIAWAGWKQAKLAEQQAVTAANLLSLQNEIEKQRNTASIFLRVHGFVQSRRHFVVLEMSNLSEVGIWIEKITVHLKVSAGLPNKAHTLSVAEPLASMGKKSIDDFSQEIFLLVAAPGSEFTTVTFWADVEFWAKGTFRSESTIVYSADVNQWNVENLRAASS
jgi:hypothetical protein